MDCSQLRQRDGYCGPFWFAHSGHIHSLIWQRSLMGSALALDWSCLSLCPRKLEDGAPERQVP